MNRWRLLGLALILSLALLLPACDVDPGREDSASSDWSRALRVGQSSLNNPPAILVDDAGRTHLAWVAAVSGGQTFHYVRLSAAGKVEVDRNLDGLAIGYPDSPRLLKASGASAGQLHLAWIVRQAEGTWPQGFYYVRLNADGEVQGTPRCLSGLTGDVTYGTICPAPDGGLYAFWSGDVAPDTNLYGARLDATGQGATDGPPLVAGGADPEAQTDAQGRVHLIWRQRPDVLLESALYYGLYDPQTGRLDKTGPVALVKVGSSSLLNGPVLGLTYDRAYVLWSLDNRGKEAGSARTFYVTWPLGQSPQAQEPAQLWLPDDYKPAYVPARSLGFTDGAFGYTTLAPATEGFSSYVSQPAVLVGQHKELPVALTMRVSTRREDSQPTALLAFADGEPRGYQLITRADGLSVRAALAADASGNLYIIWMRNAGAFNFEVFYASTSPAVRAALDPWTPSDYAKGGLDYSWNLGAAMGFFPLAMVWGFFSFIWLGLNYLILGDVELDDRRGWAILAVAILLHFFSKSFSMPGMLTFVPIIEALPEIAGIIVGRLLIPVLLSGLGLLAMAIYLKLADHRGAFGAYMVFALVDIVISLLVYIPTMLTGGY